jgi:hypothetical protein
MEPSEIDQILARAESAMTGGSRVDLSAIGFWRAVEAAKRDPALVEAYADRIARLDRAAFLKNVPIRLPLAAGMALHVAAAAVGLGMIGAVVGTQPVIRLVGGPIWAISPWRELTFLVGVGAVLGSTHVLAHWLAGRLSGIRFTHWYTRPPLPQPGIKIEYASYLRAPARARAWMHASGAIVSKIVPFAALPFAVAARLDSWAVWLLLALGVGQLITDATLSTRYGDWKKFRREMSLARPAGAGGRP